jgi:hypothetical protein
MSRPVHSAASRQHAPDQDPASSRLGAFICVLALYLAFAGALMGLGYELWAALAGATTACVVAGEVARRVITAGSAPAVGPADPAPGLGSGLASLLSDIARALERGGPDASGPRRES